MSKSVQHAEPSPSLSCKFDDCLPMIEHLSLTEKGDSIKPDQKDSQYFSTKKISKQLTRKHKSGATRKTDNKKTKIIVLQKKIADLKTQIDKLNRRIGNCPSCQRSQFYKKQSDPFQRDLQMHLNPCQDEIKRMGNQTPKADENAGCSMEFQNIDFFNMKGMYSKEMDEFSWVYLGTLMIAMGSCCTDFDGNLNVFKVQKESVDALRRQVQKSEDKISMDFFMSKQSLPQEIHDCNEIGFDPFINKIQPASQGLTLDTIKVESVDQFELFYDNKVTFTLKYEALIAAMQYIREHCWIAMGS